ncbi:MAG: glycosyltransferase [Armatimonadota bacterium]
MNILFVAPYVPSRIRVRPFHLVKQLSQRHRVTVVALGESGGRKVEGADDLLEFVDDLHVVPHSKLRGLCQSLIALPSPIPMCAAFCWSPAMKKTISRLVLEREFDVVHIEHLRAAHFASLMGDIPVVFDSVDCLTSLFRQMAIERKNPVAKLVMLEEAIKLRRYEPRILQSFARVVITTESERAELLKMDPKIPIEVVENGVDTEYFAPRGVPRPPEKLSNAGRKTNAGNQNCFLIEAGGQPPLGAPKKIVFSGKMGYHPNAQAAMWFAQRCFPRIRERHPDAEFVIVGSGPPPDIVRLADSPGITVTGYVDDMRLFLDSAAIAVVPMMVAVGIQNKVLEAMAMELPVVASSIALRTLGADCPGTICADGPDEVVHEVLKLLENPDVAAKIGQEGRQHAKHRFSWESSAQSLEQIYGEVGGNR